MNARLFLKNISTKEDFNKIIDTLFLVGIEKRVLLHLYVEGDSIEMAAHKEGYSGQTIKRVHKRILLKVDRYMELIKDIGK